MIHIVQAFRTQINMKNVQDHVCQQHGRTKNGER